MIKLIIADDHKLIRDGLRAMLEEAKAGIMVTGEAASGKELIKMLADSDAEIVLMDINMPEMNGLEATQYLKEHFPHIKVLILSMMEQEKYVTEALKAGASGYLLKTTGQTDLIHAIQTVIRGEQYISTQIAMNLLKHMPSAPPILGEASSGTCQDLSKRELEVLHYIAEGYTNQQIGDILFTSKRTVEAHRQNLLEKTGCKNTAALIVYAARHHLLQ
jgi:DNA-binding NarL/FixJ family response regulator